MALVRCGDHMPDGRTHRYVKQVKPLNSPNDALICGRKGCLNGGCSVWLCEEEADAYNKGVEIFSTRTSRVSGKEAETGAKMRVY